MPGEREEFDIVRVAALARLRLTPSEESLYAGQFRGILAFVEQLRGIETDGVSAKAQRQAPAAAGRPDEVTPSLSADAALANAPDALESPRLIRVPKVMG
jgi:aspartyl-tRNA(Asn)/glutamyl-tRNA(Gln) amidotransferase subunit C